MVVAGLRGPGDVPLRSVPVASASSDGSIAPEPQPSPRDRPVRQCFWTAGSNMKLEEVDIGSFVKEAQPYILKAIDGRFAGQSG